MLPGGESLRRFSAGRFSARRRRTLVGLVVVAVSVCCLGLPVRAVAGDLATGSRSARVRIRAGGASQGVESAQDPEPKTPLGDSPQEIADVYVQLLNGYRARHGRYPWRFWPANYLLLGLDPIYWVVGVEGIRYYPSGEYVGLVNVERDCYQLYVQTPDEAKLLVADGQAIWLSARDGRAYWRHKPGDVPAEDLVEVRLETLSVVRRH